MDVELLRPGTVPISPDTVLWFEFLLNPSLLKTHLSKSSSDPTPTDLIIKFVTINSEQKEQQNQEAKINENNEAINDVKPQTQANWNHKNIALKILSLKVASHLEWDLEYFLKKLPLAIQSTILQDLFFITMENIIEIPNIPENPPQNLSNRALFTLVLYHRWVLNAIVFKALNNKQSRQFFSYNAVAQESNMVTNGINDDLIKKLESEAPKSINFLNQVLQINDIKPVMLTFDTFQMLTESSTEINQNWDQVHFISDDEFKCQINYDLAAYHIYKEEYKNAKICITQSMNLFKKLNTNNTKLKYCKIEKERLDGYCLACQVSVEDKKPTLTQQLLASIKDQYSNIIEILKADNIEKKIPQVYRDNLELDIQGGVANRKIVVARDLLLQIKCLNLVLKVLTNEPLIGDYIYHIKSAGSRGLDMLFWAFNDVLPKSSFDEKKYIARHFLYLVLVGEIDGLADRILNDPNYSCLYNQEEILEIKSEASSQDADIPDLLLKNDWGVKPVDYIQKTRIQMHQLEQSLIVSYDPQDIKKILTEISCLNNSNLSKPLWQISNTWEIPIPLQSVIAALPDGFLKNYSYILIAKSKELVLLKDFLTCKELLYAVENEVHSHLQKIGSNKHSNTGSNLIFKLQKLLSWEMLFIEICYCLHAWPATNICDTKALTERAKQCLTALQSTDQVIPRQEVIEHCAVFLLNMGEWDYLTSLEKQLGCFEFVAALSNAAKYTTSPKFPKETWEMVLAACKPSRDLPQKRSTGSSGTNISRDTLASISVTFNRLRDVTILNIAISLLARLHNILKDETSLELYTLYLNLWPSTINNQKGYNIRIMGEYLFQLLTQALKYYPNNVPWLRLMGDLNFVLGYYESAMKYYLEAIIVVSDLFTAPIRPPIDDFVYRRMIKCCAQLQCYTQAVVLCQFLDEVDYALAFKMAGNEQKNSAPADAMDAYYHCIWDTTILEYLINLHTKRGEHHRKQLAVKVIGLLELNSNNNEEIQREAANVRKARFLRALAKQYVY